MHVRFFLLYKNKSKCPFLKCCHVMLVILSRASIYAVSTGWCSNSILAPASACALLSFKINQENNSQIHLIFRNNLKHFVVLRSGPYHPAVLHHHRDWEVRIHFRRVLMLSIFMYSQCLCTYLHLNSSQNKSTTKVTSYLQQRQARQQTTEMPSITHSPSQQKTFLKRSRREEQANLHLFTDCAHIETCFDFPLAVSDYA